MRVVEVVVAQLSHATGQSSLINLQATSSFPATSAHSLGSGDPLQNSLHLPVPVGHTPSSSALRQTLLNGSWHANFPSLADVRQLLQKSRSCKPDVDGVGAGVGAADGDGVP